ncbi:substrate-binding domain-containing protein [Streptomyces sp. NPDC015414]|uniref:LacI family DNA-binding transcriptional regulator n=1 Tax=Streptomyces sp. NPDC015414 TaxID=3364957 RepID=UPI003700E805
MLNGHPNVSDAVRARVTQAIEQLGYRRNSTARALATRRSSILGVVCVGMPFHGPTSMLFAVEEAARSHGYYISLANLSAVDRASMREALDRLIRASVEGIVVIAPVVAAVNAMDGLATQTPLVMVEAGDRTGPGAFVDQEAGARLATAHLMDLGHRTVHHVRGPQEWHEAEARVQGWLKELVDRGARVPAVLSGDWSARSGYVAGWRLAADPEVSAVFAANDQMALGVLKALRDAGRDVPGAVSVVGFDNTPESEFFSPALTTVAQDFQEAGRRCVAHLLSLVEDRAAVPQEPIKPELVIRDTTAAAPH